MTTDLTPERAAERLSAALRLGGPIVLATGALATWFGASLPLWLYPLLAALALASRVGFARWPALGAAVALLATLGVGLSFALYGIVGLVRGFDTWRGAYVHGVAYVVALPALLGLPPIAIAAWATPRRRSFHLTVLAAYASLAVLFIALAN